MYDIDIQTKISMLPESAKQEVLDFVEFLLSKYGSFSKKLTMKEKSEIAQVVTTDFEETPYHKVRHLIGTAESGIGDLGQNHRKYLRRKIGKNS